MKRLLLAILSIGVLPAILIAQQEIRLATVAPEGSVWDVNIRQMGADWRRISDGRVTLNVFPGGQIRRVVEQIRLGRPEAAALAIDDLTRLDPAFQVLALPFFLESYEEFEAVLDALEPTLDAGLDRAGLKRLAWGHGGWVRVFSSEPVETVDDLRQARLYTASDAEEMIQWYKQNGFSPVPLAVADILTGLKSGLVDAVPTTPTASMAFGWYSDLPNMLDLGVAPLVGAVVVSNRAWSRVPAAMRGELEAAAQALEQRLDRAVPDQDEASVREMQKRGLTVHTPSGDGWHTLGQSLADSLRGQTVPADIYDQAVRARDAYRANRQP